MVFLSDVLALTALSLTPLASPPSPAAPASTQETPGAASIRWVATSELADPTPFLDGGEVLLTTGLNTLHWDTEWLPYVERLSQAGVVALGFGIGLTHLQAPGALVQAAEQVQLPLFVVPRGTPFIAISQAVAELLAAAEQYSLKSALAVQHELTRAATRPNRVQALVDALASAVEGSAMVLSSTGDLIARSAAAARSAATALSPDLSDTLLARSRAHLVTLRPAGLRASLADIHPSGSLVIQPLGLGRKPVRYLAAGIAGELTAAHRSAVTTAVALLSLDDEARAERREIEHRLAEGALTLVLGGQASAAETLLSIGLPRENGVAATGLPEQIQVLRAHGTPARLDHARNLLSALHQPGLIITALLPRATDASLASDPQTDLVCLLAAPGPATAEQTLIEHTLIEHTLVEAKLQVGVSGITGLAGAATADVMASAALAQTGAFRPLVRWPELADRGVRSVLNLPAAQVFAATLLHPLLPAAEAAAAATASAAKADRDNLLQTLQVYLEHHGQMKPAAAVLGVHRNTLTHRISRIETLLGRSLADPQTRVDLWVALSLQPR